MKKSLFFVISIFSLCSFISCSHNQSTDIIYLNEDTLQSITEIKENELQWTRELESVRLLRDISKNEAVSSSVKLTSPVISIAYPEYFGSPVYPFLPGFGSLNTSLINSELKKNLDDFCSSISAWTFSEKALDSSSLFFLALFKFDIENGWKDFFDSDFPSQKKQTEISPAEEGEEVKEEKNSVFDRYIYGEPFFDEESVQIPVRFFCNKGSVDVLLYCSKDTFKFNQIIIKKWNKK